VKSSVEDALAECGRHRVLHGTGPDGPTVAIRYDMVDEIVSLDGRAQYIVRTGATIDEAGAGAATEWAAAVRVAALRLTRWADRIEATLTRDNPRAHQLPD
jgi:hypothetical protein